MLEAPLLVGEIGAGSELEPAAADREPPGDPYEIGPFTAVPTPGHAVDHVCLVLGRVCFCGDLILGEGSAIVPPAALGGSLADYMTSLMRLDGLGMDLLCPGHGGWISDPAAKITSYVEHRRDRERRLLAALDAGQRSQRALLERVWSDVPQPLLPAAELALRAHLEKLQAEGRLSEPLRD